jgi:hypothetical protein
MKVYNDILSQALSDSLLIFDWLPASVMTLPVRAKLQV